MERVYLIENEAYRESLGKKWICKAATSFADLPPKARLNVPRKYGALQTKESVASDGSRSGIGTAHQANRSTLREKGPFGSASCQQCIDQIALNIGEAEVTAGVAVGEPFVVQAPRGARWWWVQVVNVNAACSACQP